MKRISANQRTVNIISRATELGFSFDERSTLEEIRIEAEDYLIENDEATEEYCEVISTGNSQTVSYQDGFGFDYTCSGEIVNWNSYKTASQGKVYHTTIVNSEGKVVKLYDTVE